MSKLGNILESSKIMALTDGSGRTYRFLGQAEREKHSVKMYYYLWLSRLFVFTAAISLLVFLAGSLALFKLAPQVSVEPFLIINQNNSDEIVRYEPIAVNMASKEKLMEIFVKQYVMYRNSMVDDRVEMITRWFPGGMVNFLSSDEVYNNFYENEVKKKERDIEQNHLSREVEITSVGKVGGKKSSVWKVDFKTYEVSQRKRNEGTGALILTVRYWTASVTAFFVPERMFVGRRLVNHLGFTVTRYNQAEVQF